MATLRDHINLEIAALKAKLEKIGAEAPHLLDAEIAKLHAEYTLFEEHLWSEHAAAEHSPPKPESAVIAGGATPSTASSTSS